MVGMNMWRIGVIVLGMLMIALVGWRMFVYKGAAVTNGEQTFTIPESSFEFIARTENHTPDIDIPLSPTQLQEELGGEVIMVSPKVATLVAAEDCDSPISLDQTLSPAQLWLPDNRITTFTTDAHSYAIVTCIMGAYNTSDLLLLWSDVTGQYSDYINFPKYDVENNSIITDYQWSSSASNLTFAGPDQLFSYAKGRGLGDCGVSYEYTITAPTMLTLQTQYQKNECNEVWDDWPQVYPLNESGS